MVAEDLEVPEGRTPRSAPPALATLRYLVGGLVLLAVVILAYLYVGSAASGVGGAEAGQRPAAPVFTEPSFAGEAVGLSDFRGQPVVMNFWASWCSPCRAEAADLERVWQAYRDRGVVFVGVDIQDTEAEARAFLRDARVTYPNVRDVSSAIALAYGVTGIPATFFIDREGRVAFRWVGPMSQQQLVARVEELLR